MVNNPNKIIVHHSADASRGSQLEKINGWHKERFGSQARTGFWVGYHYLIEKDGGTFQTRYDDEEGCHTKGHNLDSIGVCLAGNFDIELPTAQQELALNKLCALLIKDHKIPSCNIYPHRRFSATSCYGMRLGSDWAREAYGKYLDSQLYNIWIQFKIILENYKNVLLKRI